MSNHPAGRQITTPEMIEGLRNRALKIGTDDAGSAHWMELAAARLAGLEAEVSRSRRADSRRDRRRARRDQLSPSPAQVNGYKPKSKPSTLRGGYGTGR